MTTAHQMEYAYQCLNLLMEIEERIACLHKERDKDVIAVLSSQALAIQSQADKVLVTSVS
jgi:hypothetical protein